VAFFMGYLLTILGYIITNIMRHIILLILLSLLAGCNMKHSAPYKIKMIVLGKMKERNVQAAIANFKAYLPGKQIIIDPVMLDMPSGAYYKPRNRYRADSILTFLKSKLGSYDVLMAITDLPISTTAHGHHDYGICGLSFTGKNVSVTSSYHLDKEMFLQTIRHEWGHAALGRPHCKHSGCIMNAANGKAENLRGHSRFEEKCSEVYIDFCNTLL
jgi:archaemetzincin